MPNTISSDLHSHLLRLSEPIAEILKRTEYTPNESSKVSTKDIIFSLLPNSSSSPSLTNEESIKDLALACALFSFSRSSTHELLLSWIPENLTVAGESAFCEISRDYFNDFPNSNAEKLEESVVNSEKIELLSIVLPELKDRIEKSSISKGNDAEDVSAAMARTPVGYAIIAAHQLS